MGYELHIRREPPIALEEWVAAVASIERLRIAVSDRMNRGPGDLDVRVDLSVLQRLLGEKDRWRPLVRFHHGGGHFRPAFESDNPEDPVRKALAALARKLGARIQGDDGEIYDW